FRCILAVFAVDPLAPAPDGPLAASIAMALSLRALAKEAMDLHSESRCAGGCLCYLQPPGQSKIWLEADGTCRFSIVESRAGVALTDACVGPPQMPSRRHSYARNHWAFYGEATHRKSLC